ncbi:uncharacterized protein MELLADRAFT_87199 [Melampsora larici-populina 98AG31]|uniref:Uncharacterized protein n=1 Tax=Melampsora larici-populina (strain 98AG31 / pathotype 3-4-7) TaxID=747676 RepID=F4R4V7_MELLP|nr:uncharacterized protein MELLADRAFT_87199 [Melampsora larici-populina 98AG31]EGG12875.1 hypothetical protein MELLADRAFT_87199 [Melampsora larici-populina 98AG31]
MEAQLPIQLAANEPDPPLDPTARLFGIERMKTVRQKNTSFPQTKGKKAIPTASTATSGTSNQAESVAPSVPSQGPSANLRQDSDDENARIRKKSKTSQSKTSQPTGDKQDVYDDVELYYGEPTCGPDDFS